MSEWIWFVVAMAVGIGSSWAAAVKAEHPSDNNTELVLLMVSHAANALALLVSWDVFGSKVLKMIDEWLPGRLSDIHIIGTYVFIGTLCFAFVLGLGVMPMLVRVAMKEHGWLGN